MYACQRHLVGINNIRNREHWESADLRQGLGGKSDQDPDDFGLPKFNGHFLVQR